MDEVLKPLFGEFGYWLLGIIGIIVTAGLIAVYRRFERIAPDITRLAYSNDDIKARVQHLERQYSRVSSDLQDLDREFRETADIQRVRLDGISSRLDAIVGQGAYNYQCLSDQISSMQQGIIARQEALISQFRND